MIFIANIDIKSQNIVASKEVEAEYVEDLGYECTGHPYLIADPVIDGLVHLRHPNSPWTTTAEETAVKISSMWEDICQMDDFHRPVHGELMVGTHFKVLCCKDYSPCKAGQIYNAKIADYHGFGCDGFLVEIPHATVTEPDYINVDVVEDAINHFVLA